MVINEKNVRPAAGFNYSDFIISDYNLEEYKFTYDRPEDFLFSIRMSPPDYYGDDVYEQALEAGYIRTDNIYISLALCKLYDKVVDKRTLYNEPSGNEDYEHIVPLPQEITDKVISFIWNFPGTNFMRPLSDNEKQILFDYFGISHKPIYELTLEDIGQKYYYEHGDRAKLMAGNCFNSSIGKLRAYGKEFTNLFNLEMVNAEDSIAKYMSELQTLLDSTRETHVRDLLSKYVEASKSIDYEPSFHFVNVGNVILDRKLRKLLLGHDIENLEQLVKAFDTGEIKTITGADTNEYRIIRNQTRNWFYHYLIKVPNSLR